MALGRARIVDMISDAAAAVLAGTDIDLIDVQTGRENDSRFYRIVVDRRGGIDMDTISELSHSFSDALDGLDIPDESYNLEVCSPGFDRPLTEDRDYERYAGEDVEVRLVEPVNKRTKYEGQLISRADGVLTVSVKGTEYCFDVANVRQVKRTVIF